jgi:hypothetical protein
MKSGKYHSLAHFPAQNSHFIGVITLLFFAERKRNMGKTQRRRTMFYV